jgi:hypothetical protein
MKDKSPLNKELVKEFMKHVMDELRLDSLPKINFSNDSQEAVEHGSWGGYKTGDQSIRIVIAKRHPADIFRTLAHELVHYKQDLTGRLNPGDGKTGSNVENEANSRAAIIMRNFAEAKPSLFEHLINESLDKQQIFNMAKEFMTSSSYNKSHDCKRSTYEFVNWLKKNKKFEPEVLLLAPPQDNKKFPGKSGDGDSHIFTIIDGYGVDFTSNQFPGISEPLKITPENQIPSEYKKIGGYYTLYPDWFENKKTSLKTKWSNLPN